MSISVNSDTSCVSLALKNIDEWDVALHRAKWMWSSRFKKDPIRVRRKLKVTNSCSDHGHIHRLDVVEFVSEEAGGLGLMNRLIIRGFGQLTCPNPLHSLLQVS